MLGLSGKFEEKVLIEHFWKCSKSQILLDFFTLTVSVWYIQYGQFYANIKQELLILCFATLVLHCYFSGMRNENTPWTLIHYSIYA